jgi:predicted N-acetyltransferase YhbS
LCVYSESVDVSAGNDFAKWCSLIVQREGDTISVVLDCSTDTITLAHPKSRSMSHPAITYRTASSAESAAVIQVHREAFGSEGGEEIAALLAAMLQDPTANPLLSLVAQRDAEFVGHVLFTKASLSPASDASAVILAPLAVLPDQQKQGIGGSLIRNGFELLRQQEIDLVFVLGYPDYYTRFGFQPAGILGLHAPYPIEEKNADAWMVHELTPGSLDASQGTVHCCNALNKPEYWRE